MNKEDVKLFSRFFAKMQNKIEDHQKIYSDSWKTKDFDFLNKRLHHKLLEYDLTKNNEKLISIANLAMLLYLRMDK